jgi:tryptophanyl-tRNA synthetase
MSEKVLSHSGTGAPKMSKSLSPEMIRLASAMKELPAQAFAAYSPLVEDIIRNKSRDIPEIEHLIDWILGFCFDEKMLGLFKKLCRYYYGIDPQATAEHVYAYREMWDEEMLTYPDNYYKGGKKGDE